MCLMFGGCGKRLKISFFLCAMFKRRLFETFCTIRLGLLCFSQNVHAIYVEQHNILFHENGLYGKCFFAFLFPPNCQSVSFDPY